jgi:hypothetical protein
LTEDGAAGPKDKRNEVSDDAALSLLSCARDRHRMAETAKAAPGVQRVEPDAAEAARATETIP